MSLLFSAMIGWAMLDWIGHVYRQVILLVLLKAIYLVHWQS